MVTFDRHGGRFANGPKHLNISRDGQNVQGPPGKEFQGRGTGPEARVLPQVLPGFRFLFLVSSVGFGHRLRPSPRPVTEPEKLLIHSHSFHFGCWK